MTETTFFNQITTPDFLDENQDQIFNSPQQLPPFEPDYINEPDDINFFDTDFCFPYLPDPVTPKSQTPSPVVGDLKLQNKEEISFTPLRSNSVPQISVKKPKSIQKKNVTKNIHRYMTRQIIRCMTNGDFEDEVQKMCLDNGVDAEDVKSTYLGKIEYFTSLQQLREHWTVNSNDFSIDQKMKKVFKQFSKWFLKHRAIRYILEGKMKNKLKYIHYKNHVMKYFIEKPQKYKSNMK